MKKLLMIFGLVTLVFCQGCGTLLDKLPNKSFESMNYDRVILGSTGHIDAKNAYIKDGILTVQDLHIKEVMPWGQIEINIIGYTRAIENATNDNL